MAIIPSEDDSRLRGQRAANLLLSDLLEQTKEQGLPLVEWKVSPYMGSPELHGSTWESSTEIIGAWAAHLGANITRRAVGSYWHCMAKSRIDGVSVQVVCVLPFKPAFFIDRPTVAAAS